MEKAVALTGTRNLYPDMTVSVKAIMSNSSVDRIYLFIEDDSFPEALPECVTTVNVSDQPFFDPNGPNYNTKWTYMVLMRVALSKMIDAEKVLSLDVDAIPCRNIDELWDIDLGDHYFAMVPEIGRNDRKGMYCNFGVVMQNLAQIRKDRMDDTLIRALNTNRYEYNEQDAVAELCQGRILPLSSEWNSANMTYNITGKREDNPRIRHFIAFPTYLHTSYVAPYVRMTMDEAEERWRENRKKAGKTSEFRTEKYPEIRWEVINQFIRRRGYHSFLEIGTAKGDTFREILCPVKVSVDPDPETGSTYHKTSDAYFRDCSEMFDIVFIDGLHECHQVWRDIQNSLRHLNPGGVIVMHDCHPTSYIMQMRMPEVKYGSDMPWTGDTWKAFVKARAELPYEMYVIDRDMGCGVIDTAKEKTADTRGLPREMDKMRYQEFINHPEWMDYREWMAE